MVTTEGIHQCGLTDPRLATDEYQLAAAIDTCQLLSDDGKRAGSF